MDIGSEDQTAADFSCLLRAIIMEALVPDIMKWDFIG
jgi:hypothetical protein